MKKALAIIMLVLLVMTAVTVMAHEYPKIYERDKTFKYCSVIDHGYMMSLETQGTQWTTTKVYSSHCYP